MEIGSTALILMLTAFPFTGIGMIGAAFFQALGKAVPAMTLILLRQIILLIPLVRLFPGILGVQGVWAAIPITKSLGDGRLLS